MNIQPPDELVDDAPIPPIFQLHGKKLFVQGLAKTPAEIAKKILALMPTPTNEIQGDQLYNTLAEYFSGKIRTSQWLEERRSFLDSAYKKMIADGTRISEHIDLHYDLQVFSGLRDLLEEKITHTKRQITEKDKIPTSHTLNSLARTAKTLYECQRTARGLSQHTTRTLNVKMEQNDAKFLKLQAQAKKELEITMQREVENTSLDPL
jgi:hypothetical protein